MASEAQHPPAAHGEEASQAAHDSAHPPAHGHDDPTRPGPKAHPGIQPKSPAKKPAPPSSIHSATTAHGSEAATETAPPRPMTVVCGAYPLAQEWTPNGSPYLLVGDVFIPKTSRLRIDAGVEIRIAAKPGPCPEDTAHDAAGLRKRAHAEPAPTSAHPASAGHDTHPAHPAEHSAPGGGQGKAAPVLHETGTSRGIVQEDWADSNLVSLKIEGGFLCLGEPSRPVRILPEKGSADRVAWDGIRIKGKRIGEVEIAHTEIRGAHAALRVEASEFFVHHTLLQDNNVGLHLTRRADLWVVNSVLTGHRSAAAWVQGSSPRFVNSVFVGNRGYGVWNDGGVTLALRHNAFWDNGDVNCYRCPHAFLKPVPPPAADGKAESGAPAADLPPTDGYGNLLADPVFYGSPAHRRAEAADPSRDTPQHLVADTTLARLEKESRGRFFALKEKPKAAFKKRGDGPYALSPYSPLLGRGAPSLKNPDGSRSDIGLFGGPEGRMDKAPF